MIVFGSFMESLDFLPGLTTENCSIPFLKQSQSILSYDEISVKYVNSSNLKPDILLAQASETICIFFIQQVKQAAPELVLQKFKQLFIEPTQVVDSQLQQALIKIAVSGAEETFLNTFKRSIYILLNNWNAARKEQYTQELVQLIAINLDHKEVSPRNMKILQLWRRNFIASQDYQELLQLTLKINDHQSSNWSQRYNSYLLVYQSVDQKKSLKQKTTAKTRSLALKKEFRSQLAMYTARLSVTGQQSGNSPNPTVIGKKVLSLIKKILQKRSSFSYTNLARIFINQAQDICYKDFKHNLLNYLFYSLNDQDLDQTAKKQLIQYLDNLYDSYHTQPWDNQLLLRTCNRLIEYLITVNQANPSPLFIYLVTQGRDLTLAIILLKLVLLCPQSRTNLECRIAQLIEHYQSQSASDCQWLINFLEVLQVTLGVYAEDVQYNLVEMSEAPPEIELNPENHSYRIFSQMKRKKKTVSVKT
ncbi:MAG: hypothetical protein F6J86_09560 [Symploca sp. SIO1B1]|nr:hypothetical protein [Symploca sp. SIO1B1]